MQQVSDLLGGWIDEVIVIGLMAGLLLVAFSRERDEDEYTTRLRASSLVWAVLADSLFVLLATCFLYEFAYLYALFLQLFCCSYCTSSNSGQRYGGRNGRPGRQVSDV